MVSELPFFDKEGSDYLPNESSVQGWHDDTHF